MSLGDASDHVSHLEALATGAGIGLFGRIAGRLVAVMSGVVAARFLGPVQFGLYSIGLAVLRSVEALVPLGFDVGIIKYGTKFFGIDDESLKGIILYSMLFSFLLGVAAGAVFYVAAPWIAYWLRKEELVVVLSFIAFLIPLPGLLALGASATRITQNMRYSFIVQDFGQPSLTLVFLLLFVKNWGLKGALLSEFLAYLVSIGIAVHFLRRLFPAVFSLRVRALPPGIDYYSFSFASSLTVVLSTLTLWVDRLIMGYYLPASVVGLYQAAAQLSFAFAVILSGLNRIVVPIFADLQNRFDSLRAGEVYSVSTKWAVYLSFPVFLVFLMNPANVLSALYGKEYASGAMVLVILLVGQFVNVGTGPVAPLLVVSGHQKFVLLLSFFTLMIDVAMNLALTPRLGEYGAALSTSLSIALLYACAVWYAGSRVQLWPYDKRFIKSLVAMGVTVIAMWITKPLLAIPSFIELGFQFFIAVVVFLLALTLLKFESEDRMLFSVVVRMFSHLRNATQTPEE